MDFTTAHFLVHFTITYDTELDYQYISRDGLIRVYYRGEGLQLNK